MSVQSPARMALRECTNVHPNATAGASPLKQSNGTPSKPLRKDLLTALEVDNLLVDQADAKEVQPCPQQSSSRKISRHCIAA